MKLRNSIAIGAIGLAACGTPQVLDNSPENPTAVLETLVSNGGIAGMFPYEMTDKHYVRSNMRRDEHNLKGTGLFSGYLVTTLAGGADAAITRLDEDHLWKLHIKKKEYTECPAHGCPLPSAAEKEEKQAQDKAEKEQPKQQTEQNCTTHVAGSSFDVKPTGEKKTLNGFDSSRYAGAWVLKIEDAKKRTTTSTVSFDVWTTPLSQGMREAFGVEQTFAKAYVAGRPRTTAPGIPDRSQVMPAEVTKMMTAYLSSLRPADRAAIANAGKQLARIQGHPVYTHIEWRMEGDACGDKSGAQEHKSQPGSTTDMLAGALGNLIKKDPAGPPPLLSFTIEVKAIGVQPVKDSVFAVPAGFKKTN